MGQGIQVAIVERQQSTVDGYAYRLSKVPSINIVANFYNAEDLRTGLVNLRIDVLICGIDIPVSLQNQNPFPIFILVDHINQNMLNTKILVVSYINQRQIFDTLLQKGINGFVLKDDQQSIKMLGRIVEIISSGGFYFSKELQQDLFPHPDAHLLTERQFEALSLCAAFPDEDTFSLAKKMKISGSTLRNLLSSVYSKLGVRTRAAAILKARQTGVIPPASISDSYFLIDQN